MLASKLPRNGCPIDCSGPIYGYAVPPLASRPPASFTSELASFLAPGPLPAVGLAWFMEGLGFVEVLVDKSSGSKVSWTFPRKSRILPKRPPLK